MRLFKRDRKKKKKAFTLVEMLVALGIVAVIMVLFFNVITISIEVIYKSLARNFLREELTEITNLIVRDVRNADLLIECSTVNGCEVIVGGEQVRWAKCGDQICKDLKTGEDAFGNAEYGTRFLTTSDSIIFNDLTFEEATFISEDGNPAQQTVLITLIAEHANPETEIDNNFRQVTVSTRNYEI